MQNEIYVADVKDSSLCQNDNVRRRNRFYPSPEALSAISNCEFSSGAAAPSTGY